MNVCSKTGEESFWADIQNYAHAKKAKNDILLESFCNFVETLLKSDCSLIKPNLGGNRMALILWR